MLFISCVYNPLKKKRKKKKKASRIGNLHSFNCHCCYVFVIHLFHIRHIREGQCKGDCPHGSPIAERAPAVELVPGWLVHVAELRGGQLL